MTYRNFPSFFDTLSLELNAQADRVRHLIGSSHWLSDGTHKEALLRGMIERYAPDATAVSKAFVVEGTRSSTEQDIVIVNTYCERPLFHQGGLIIAASETVLASISVKTKLSKKEFCDALSGLETLPVPPNTTWQGIYFFNQELDGVCDLRALSEKLKGWIASSPPRSQVCVRLSNDLLALLSPTQIKVHRCPGASTAYFMSRLMNSLASTRGGQGANFSGILDAVSAELETVEVPLD